MSENFISCKKAIKWEKFRSIWYFIYYTYCKFTCSIPVASASLINLPLIHVLKHCGVHKHIYYIWARSEKSWEAPAGRLRWLAGGAKSTVMLAYLYVSPVVMQWTKIICTKRLFTNPELSCPNLKLVNIPRFWHYNIIIITYFNH